MGPRGRRRARAAPVPALPAVPAADRLAAARSRPPQQAARHPDAAEVRTFADGEVLDVPGQPRVRHLPGHTRGNCALHLQDASVVFSGDTLVTFDPYRRRRGPRLLVKGVNEDNEQARTSLDALAELNAQLLLPGHGEPWPDGVAAAVADARRRGYW